MRFVTSVTLSTLQADFNAYKRSAEAQLLSLIQRVDNVEHATNHYVEKHGYRIDLRQDQVWGGEQLGQRAVCPASQQAPFLVANTGIGHISEDLYPYEVHNASRCTMVVSQQRLQSLQKLHLGLARLQTRQFFRGQLRIFA